MTYKFSFPSQLIMTAGLMLLLLPESSRAAEDLLRSSYAAEVLRPEKLFEVLKKNITIPIPSGKEVRVLDPKEALKDASPKLQQFNKEVQEETGIDLSKFIGWVAKIFRELFRIIIDFLEKAAALLKP